MARQKTCNNCGGNLSQEQIEKAVDDAGFDLLPDETREDVFTFYCSDYSELQGCQGGNDPQGMAYWESTH